MLPPSLLTEPRIRCRVEVTSKKRLLESLAELLATAVPHCSRASVFDLLNERERLGSTGLGEGIALPHARIEGIDQAVGAFVHLDTGVSFDAPDDRPVDLAFGLLVPQEATDAHLSLLAGLAERFSDQHLRSELRDANDPRRVLELLQRGA